MYFELLDDNEDQILTATDSGDILRALDVLSDDFDISDYTIMIDYVNADGIDDSRKMTSQEFVEEYMPL